LRYRITHRTAYTGQEPVSIGHNKAWLEPRPVVHQQLESFQLKIDPVPSVINHQVDYFGNPVVLFSFNEGYHELNVTALSYLKVVSPGDDILNGSRLGFVSWESVRDTVRRHELPDTLQGFEFTFASPGISWTAEMNAWARQSFPSGRSMLEAVLDLTHRIHTEFAYDSKATTVATPVQDVFRIRRGVCQDFAHLQVALLRSMGLAARYVSGYLRTIPPPGRPRLIGADASHAWVSVYIVNDDSRGIWVDLDPTNDRLCSTDHVTLAWGRDYNDVPPLNGVIIGGGKHSLSVSVDVLPLERD
jgi:transglutaminase-like putative cysteine protease